MRIITLALLLTVAIMQSATADELIIESLDGTGELTFTTITNGAEYRVEWAPSPSGPWTNFSTGAASLDSIIPTNNGGITVAVPMCYRVVATTPSVEGALVINEVDYDQPSIDTADFLEIYNTGAFPVSLSAYRLEFVSANSSNIYMTIELSEAGTFIPTHGFLVVGNTSVVNNIEGAITIEISGSIQNGPSDGIRLVKQDGTFIDGIAYEGALPGVGEGEPSTGENDIYSLQRVPDGTDTDDNATDFSLATPTPGSSNTAP